MYFILFQFVLNIVLPVPMRTRALIVMKDTLWMAVTRAQVKSFLYQIQIEWYWYTTQFCCNIYKYWYHRKFILNSFLCYNFAACSSNCLECSSASVCTDCALGYVIVNNACTGKFSVVWYYYDIIYVSMSWPQDISNNILNY